ncbi:hypothetical protein BTW15_11650 [Pseudomonas syringae pv. tomato]|uniref:Uncharacterized protein n=1 Tax=Pseudomonas syringae pv. tomato TaxID=323 RepID=A0AB36KTS7_PSEUB|nr:MULTISPECIES: hypothetical protein [Pseudomonas syringae group]KPB83346.1 Uncharacterized protein AC505_0453 [Pseudomonas syringae pv. maculicola]KPW38024.1 Uncharacterized protein ALO87_00308 [Pseudomonas syringae pv. apii]MBI6849309.1 hypothetical protein [Pseudomonas syringae]MBX6508620.1 hypothetical protein [Pseudomonas syringae pv. tomato]OPE60076.1 hypothetical protein BTW15_11650 [Pseudomonas syringae pv. tomato]
MWNPGQYRRVVRSSAWYDLIVTGAFITPWTFEALHGALTALSQQWNLPGDLPAFAPMQMLMANLLGSIVCVWAVLRIRDPQSAFGRYDAGGRLLFATWQAYALAHGASSLLIGFMVAELIWAAMQLWPVRGRQESY